MGNKYDDIIDLPHHISKKHPRMSLEDRSAQFASFAALTGYEDIINETARITNAKIELDEESKLTLNRKIQEIKKKINEKLNITITYFIPDLKKTGGRYVTINGIVKKIDEYKKILILEDKTEILISDIVEIKL